MKQNLLKYGLVMVLAMIASMGLLWAEEKESVGVKSDTTAQVEAIDSLSCDSAAKIPVLQKEEVGNDKERDAEQKEGASLWTLMLPAIIIISLALMYGIYAIFSSKDNRKLIKEKKFLRACAKVINNAVPQDGLSVIGAISILLLLITISTFLLLLTTRWADSSNYHEFGLQRLGQIGDFSSGVIGTLIAFIVAIYAIRTYKLERQQQNEASVSAMLSTMLDLHKQNVSEIEVTYYHTAKKKYKGRDAFEVFVSELREIYGVVYEAINKIIAQGPEQYGEWSSESNKKRLAHMLSYGYFFYDVDTYLITDEGGSALFMLSEMVRAEARQKIPEKMQDLQRHMILGHYYRHLFNMVNFIDKHSFTSKYEKKSFYVKLIRSQLSDYEQILLYYNSLSTLGFDWNKPLGKAEIDEMNLICKYRLVKNCPYYIPYFGIDPRTEMYEKEKQAWWKKKELFLETDPQGQKRTLDEMVKETTVKTKSKDDGGTAH